MAKDFERGWVFRTGTEKLDRLVRAAISKEEREFSRGVWFVTKEHDADVRRLFTQVHGDEVRFCVSCAESKPCKEVWRKRALDEAGIQYGAEALESIEIFDDLEEMLGWFEANRPAPMQNPSQGMSEIEAAKLLGLTLPATPEQIDAAFKKAAFQNHPDRGGSNETMAKMIQARAVLRGGT